jgi:hypothetical protein
MYENLGELISYIRTKIFGLSLLDFSELMNQSSSALQRYENNDFGVKFNKNKHIKIKELSEKIAAIVFDEHKIIRKTKNFYVNSNITKIEYNIKKKLLSIYSTKNPDQIIQLSKLESIDSSTKEGLTEFLYTYFLYFIEGTSPHEIRPRFASVLRFQSGTDVVFTKLVNHPGTKPSD